MVRLDTVLSGFEVLVTLAKKKFLPKTGTSAVASQYVPPNTLGDQAPVDYWN